MNFLKKAFNNVSQEIKVIQQKGKEAINKIEQKVQQELNGKQNIEPIKIIDRVYWMNFPSPDKIGAIAKLLNKKFEGCSYYIWNVSEHKYEVFPFKEQVADHNMPGYPNPSVQEIFMICKSILSWLESDPTNVAIIHCQNTRGRSALIISCLLCLNKNFVHPGEALTFFCKQTKTKDMKILFPSQQLYLNYFSNILSGIKLNQKPLLLKKIIFSEVPKILRKNNQGQIEETFRPYLQVFKDATIIYNSLSKGRVPSYSSSDLSIWFELDGVEVKEDILFRCKHYHSNDLRYPVFRMMVHTGFAHDNVLRLLKTDIDFTSNVEVSDAFFIDIIFEEKVDKKQDNNQNVSNLEYIVGEVKRQLDKKEEREEEQEESDKEIQRILRAEEKIDQPAAFAIGQFPISNRKDSSGVEEEERKSEGKQNEEEDETQVQEKEKASKLLLENIDQDHELDNQEIDDYFDNLEKSDDEA